MTTNSTGRGTKLTSFDSASEDENDSERMGNAMANVLNRLNISNDHDEIIETMDDLKKTLTELDRKEKTIRVIETLAMTSKDPSIADMRKEMFTTVKLIHSDEVKAAVDRLVGGPSDGDLLVYNGSSNTGHWNLSSATSGTISVGSVDSAYELIETVNKKQNLYQRIKKALKNE